MLFFFKEKKLVIDAFCSVEHEHAYTYNKIDYAHKFYPQWWKNLPSATFNFNQMTADLNMKSCRGLVDHYQKGLILPLWSDLAVSLDGKGIRSTFSDNVTQTSFHSPEMRGGIYPNDINFKLMSPWVLKSEKNVYFNFLPAFWSKEDRDPWELTPGTLEFYYQHGVNLNLFLDNKPKNFIIKQGTPIGHIIPLTERKIELKHHLVDQQEWDRIYKRMSMGISFFKKYQNHKKIIDKQEDNTGKCPFGFGK